MAALSEFELIERFFAPLSSINDESVELGIGDDCGVVSIPHGHSLCFSIDTLVEGVHFPVNAPPYELAYRSLAVSLSDLAAMGAKPFFFTLALTLPETDPQWLKLFSHGLKALAERHQVSLLGGDTTKGPLTISIQVHGLLDKPALRRSGAQEGDVLAVSGSLGDAGAALALLGREHETNLNNDEAYLLNRYYKPSPRIDLGQHLLPYASACIDISDGLLAEASHISAQSSVRLDIDSALLPLSGSLIAVEGFDQAKALALCAGDDYELLFTVSKKNWAKLASLITEGMIHEIGKVSKGSGVYLDNKSTEHRKKGYQHFD